MTAANDEPFNVIRATVAKHNLHPPVFGFSQGIDARDSNQGPAMNSDERIREFRFKRFQGIVDEVLPVAMKYADIFLVGEKI